MTDMEQNGDNQSSSNFASPPVSTPSSTPSQAPAESERTFKQSEVNDLVGRAKSEAIERFKRDSSMASHNTPQYPQQPNQPYQGYVAPQPQNQGKTDDDFRRIAAEETQKFFEQRVQATQQEAHEQEAKNIATQFYAKIDAGRANLPDFDKVMADVDLRTIPYHVQLANMVDNTAEVMYELAKNPSKIGSLQNLIDIDLRAGRSPRLAIAEMKRLSESIKENAQGSKFRTPNEPLSQLKPSNAGTGNQGALTHADYKKEVPRLSQPKIYPNY